MSFKVEQLEEKNMVKLVIEASAEDFAAGIEKAFQKNKNKIAVPGFRKGKAPRKMIEKMYGEEIFYEDAANAIIPDAYAKAADESGLEIVSQPKIELVTLEKGQPFVFSAEVAVKPEVTLGQYKGIEVAKADLSVSDEEVDEEINKARENNARMITVEDRPVEDGDMTVIDFEGFVDGEAFEGGKGEDYSLTIGSHSFIDTFEQQLIGKNVGEEVEVNVTFPEEYHSEELKGKPAMFKVVVKEIKKKELPELDDDFAQDVSECDTLEAYKASVKEKLAKNKETEAIKAKEDEAIAKLIDDSQMDIPAAMIDTQVRQMAEDFTQRLQMQGLSVEQYFQFTGLTPDRFLADLKPEAEKRIQSRLVLEAVAKAEGIEATDAEYEEELNKMASMYNMEVEKIKEFMGEAEGKQVKSDIAVSKAAELIVKEAVEK